MGNDVSMLDLCWNWFTTSDNLISVDLIISIASNQQKNISPCTAILPSNLCFLMSLSEDMNFEEGEGMGIMK